MAVSPGNTILPGYPQFFGTKYEVAWDHAGPASYNNTGTFATSGETINAADLGLGGFDVAFSAGLSSDGLNTALILLPNSGNRNAVPSFVVHYFVQSTGAEVANGVNLSTKAFRFNGRMV